MLQLTQLWTGISLRQQIIIGVATLGMFIGILFAARTTLAPDMALLYSGLDAPAAGEVVAALEQQGVAHEVRNGAIYVEVGARDRLRMVLASQGLPTNGAAGYELLDGLSGFGTTAQMFDAAYWRAKEGELARTISASPGIRAARVHIARANPRPFQQGSDSAASVSVTPNGQTLSTAQARALRFLVASAVPGLEADAVTIIDGRTGMLVEGTGLSGFGSTNDHALSLRRNVTRLIEAHVGIGNAVVEVNVEHVSEHETLVERRFDPEERVIVSTESTEKSSSNEGGTSNTGNVSVASNLPDGDATGNSGGTGEKSAENESREIVNFEVSETTREILRTPGAIKRISVAVLVNGIETEDDTGTLVYAERSEEELDSLQQLVASAVGFNADRGDIITIRSMNLDRSARLTDLSEPIETSIFASLDLMKLIQIGVLAAVALILGLFVIRPILKPVALLPTETPVRLEGDSVNVPGVSTHTNEIHGALSNQPNQQHITSVVTNGTDGGSNTVVNIESPGTTNETFEFPAMETLDTELIDPEMVIAEGTDGDAISSNEAVIKLRSLIVSRRAEALEVLRGWLDTDVSEEKETTSQ